MGLHFPTQPEDSDREILSEYHCTIYVKTWSGQVRKLRVREVHVRAGEFAQYTNAISVRFKQPRQRKFRGFTESYRPFVVVVAGDGPEPDSGFIPLASSGPGHPLAIDPSRGVRVTKSRYMSHDERYDTDFYALINASGAKVLFTSEGWDSHDSSGRGRGQASVAA